MRLSSKIVGAGLILTGTVLAGCNCDSCRHTASSQNPGPGPYLASKQQPGRTNWGGQPNLPPLVRTGAAGQPVYAPQAWNNTPASASGGAASGDMNARTNTPAIPVTSNQTSAGTSPLANNSGFGAPMTAAGNYNTQPATPSYGNRTAINPAAYSASPGTTGAYRSTTSMGSYGGTSPNYGSGNSISPVGGTATNSSGSPSNAPIYNIPGNKATAPSADPSASSNPSGSMTGSGSGTPTDTGSAKGTGN